MPPKSDDGTILVLHVTPKSRANQIGPLENDVLRVRVTAAASEGAANEAVIRLLAQELNVPKSALEIVSGRWARHKRIIVRGPDANEVARRLTSSLGEASA